MSSKHCKDRRKKRVSKTKTVRMPTTRFYGGGAFPDSVLKAEYIMYFGAGASIPLQDSDVDVIPLAALQIRAIEPPRFAEYLAFFLPKDNRDALLGDIVETYPKLRMRQGKRRADFWAYIQVFTSFWFLIGSKLIKAGIILWVGNWVRKFIK